MAGKEIDAINSGIIHSFSKCLPSAGHNKQNVWGEDSFYTHAHIICHVVINAIKNNDAG